ncbi:pheophytinase, chloroplastic isoform X1 [Nicotiana tabacum]|uniref:Pheophytinase, chloroplastic n=2 Tax=Nicotiana TaxID=4085 RepID=A0A1S3ZGU1_TOBAC|nr:PREDICTED: pheophytinase, chloroplastic-like [Nicotiana sylvestris]XP_016463685.1 PREDICTED: pheophytinase, chloroplastic-like [Nicotiana tabacum]
MEIISCHSTSFYYVVNIRGKATGKCPGSNQASFPILKEERMCYVLFKPSPGALRYSGADQFCIKRPNRSRICCPINAFKEFENFDSSALGKSYNSYVVDGKEGKQNVTGVGKSVPKVIIPGLPDEDNKGDFGAPISSWFWEWKPKLNVHYEKSGCENVNSPPVLFLPGFGVGSFHYEKQLKDLGRDHRIWAIDFLGQGKSLPCEDLTSTSKEQLDGDVWGFGEEAKPWAKELVYSIDLWKEQVHYFIEEVIKEPVYIVGNSLGGYVAIYFAARYPHLVKGVTLLNATPFWGFFPNPVKSPRLSSVFPWTGSFPLPTSVRMLTEVVWEKISGPEFIAKVLKQVYADNTTKFDKVFTRILETTKHPAAAAVFASIMFAPRGQVSFEEALSGCQMKNVPVCLMYGKEDPWVKPIWGLQVKRQLPEAPYYEISPAGHCPHDEAPEVVNFLLRGWVRSLESHGSVALPLLETPENVDYDIARDLEFSREGLKRSVLVQFYGSMIPHWKRVSTYLKTQFQN